MQNSIKDLRNKNNIRQEDLANSVNVTRQTINAIENEKYNPTLILAYKISKYFNKKIEDIFLFN